MPLDYYHPKVIKFLKESYEKETIDRTIWFNKNKDQIIKGAALNEKHKGYFKEDVNRILIEKLIPSLSVHHNITKANCITKVPRQDLPPLRTTTKRNREPAKIKEEYVIPDAKMKPVDPIVKKILYEEVPIGRKMYLKVRNKIPPENRYYFCETSNNVYGWGLDYSEFAQSSKYKFYASLRRGAMSRSGPQPDPKHYGRAFSTFSKCNTISADCI